MAARLLEKIGYDSKRGNFRPGSLFGAGTNGEVIAALYPGLCGEQLEGFIHAANQRAALVTPVALPGIVDALRRLHHAGYRLGIATNDSAAGAMRMLESFGLTSLFDAALGYDSVANPKPAPDVVHAFAAATDLPVREVAMVGDNLHDLIAAREAGAGLAIGVLSGNSGREELAPMADLIIDSVLDLLTAIGPAPY